MGDRVGVVATSITFRNVVAQLADRTSKLRSYQQRFHEDDEYLRGQIEQLETHSKILSMINDNQYRSPASRLMLDSDSYSWCLRYCHTSVIQLQAELDKLNAEFKIKQDHRPWLQLRRLKARLELPILLLFSSTQVYIR